MTIICPKCSHVRSANETTTPDWQCPACGVVYAKVGEVFRSTPQARSGKTDRYQSPSVLSSMSWGKLLLIVLLIVSVWKLVNRISGHPSDVETWVGTSANESATVDQLASLAASVREGEVVMYTTTECQYCAQAKSWLQQYGFVFSECNMRLRPECEREFKSFGANGTPFLLVRGKQMKNGFDSDEFIALLKK